MIVCKICNKSFLDRKSFSNHISRTESSVLKTPIEREKFIVETLYGEYDVSLTVFMYINGCLNMYDIGKSNVDIRKYLEIMGLKRSSKDERATLKYKNKMKNSLMIKYGEGVENVFQVPSIRLKIKETLAETYGSYDKYLEHQRVIMREGHIKFLEDESNVNKVLLKQKETCLERYGNENFGAGAVAKEKRMSNRKITLDSMTADEKREMTSLARQSVCSRGGYESKLEKRVQLALDKLNIKYLKHFHSWNYNYDILLENKIIIEIQGDFWHANPLKFKKDFLVMGKILASDLWEKDRRKKEVAESNGYCVIYIWESEIKKLKEDMLMLLLLDRLKERLPE